MGIRNPKKTWFLTYPQNESSPEVLLSELKDVDTVLEYVIAQELHKDGTPHLHAYVKYKTGVKLSEAPNVFNVLEKSGNYQPTRSCKAVVAYVTKGTKYISNIDVEKYQAKKGKVTSETLRTYTSIQALDGGIVGLNSLKSYEYARSLAITPKERESVCGIWLWGPPGSGKSHAARHYDEANDVYIKAQNKWWDGYTGQATVILEDLDTNVLGHLLKLWTDKWSHQGEIKGGAASLCHDTFIVTSNYEISELFKGDDKNDNLVLREALERRFISIYLEVLPDEERNVRVIDWTKPIPGPNQAFARDYNP